MQALQGSDTTSTDMLAPRLMPASTEPMQSIPKEKLVSAEAVKLTEVPHAAQGETGMSKQVVGSEISPSSNSIGPHSVLKATNSHTVAVFALHGRVSWSGITCAKAGNAPNNVPTATRAESKLNPRH